MKKIIAAAAAVCCMGIGAYAQTPSVVVNGETVTFDVQPYIKNDFTLVPLRGVFEKLGAQVTWDADNRTVIAVKSDGDQNDIVVLQIGNTKAFVNGEEKTLEAQAELSEGRTMIPLRFVSEALGADVEWDPESFSAIITY